MGRIDHPSDSRNWAFHISINADSYWLYCIIRHVAASDIRFFSMAECPEAPALRDDLATTTMEDGNESQGENHTHVYFYVTSGDKADPGLTEKFPLFPTDLLISERLTYLLPRVCTVTHASHPFLAGVLSHFHLFHQPFLNTKKRRSLASS